MALAREGDRIRLVRMGDDPDPIPSGSEGTVTMVNESRYFDTQIAVAWDSGRSLMLIEGTDVYTVIGRAEA